MQASLTTGKNLEIDEFLAQYDGYIHALARNCIHKIRSNGTAYSLDMEIDELVQRVRIKLWRILLRQRITSPKAYIASMIHNEMISMLRQRQHTDFLTCSDEGEPYYGHLLISISEGMADPAYEVEQLEISSYYLSRVARAIASLAPRQRRAMICSLKDRLDDFASFITAYSALGFDVDIAAWPNKRDEVQRLKACISYARKNVRSRMSTPSPTNS